MLGGSSSLPTLTPESRHILTRFLALNLDPLALAADLAKDLIEVFSMLADESLAAWITHVQSLMTARRRELALQTLEQICKTSPDPIEQRRSATRLLSATRRAIEVASPPEQKSNSKKATTGESTSMPVTPLTRPNSSHSAQETLRTMLEAIKNKSQSQAQSRATLDAHISIEANINGSTIEDNYDDSVSQFENDPNFAPLKIIHRDVEITYEPPTQDTETTFEQPISFKNPHSTTQLLFTLSHNTQNWIITKIQAPP
ncbi:MAG: hypothetical protein U0640_14245 [Phycisphaerales bacterium]